MGKNPSNQGNGYTNEQCKSRGCRETSTAKSGRERRMNRTLDILGLIIIFLFILLAIIVFIDYSSPEKINARNEKWIAQCLDYHIHEVHNNCDNNNHNGIKKVTASNYTCNDNTTFNFGEICKINDK